MSIELITTLISTSVTVIMFLLSTVLFVRSKARGYFEAFCVLAFFSFMAGHIFDVILEAVGKSSYNFTLGSLGIVSGLLCISFSCKTVQKVDEEEDAAKRRKHSLIALIAPAYFILCFVIMLCAKLSADKMVNATLYLFSAMPCSYYCLKNAVTPYPKESMMHCLKPFFVSVLVYCAVMMLSEVSWLIDGTGVDNIAVIIFCTVNVLLYILMPATLIRGNRKWKTI